MSSSHQNAVQVFFISTTAEVSAATSARSLWPDDKEFIIIKLDKPLDKIDGDDHHADGEDDMDDLFCCGRERAAPSRSLPAGQRDGNDLDNLSWLHIPVTGAEYPLNPKYRQ